MNKSIVIGRSILKASRCFVMSSRSTFATRCLSSASFKALLPVMKSTNDLKICGMMNCRYFASLGIPKSEILKEISDCGINDAGKEKVVKKQIADGNYDNLYEASQELLGSQETRELGVLSNVLLAEANYPKSMIEVGNMYYMKYNNEVNDSSKKTSADVALKNSIDWLSRAVKTGDSAAKALLGKIYLEIKDDSKIEEGLALLEEAGSQNHADALFNLGMIYFDGMFNKPKDESRAISYFTHAADLQDVSSQFFMGQYYIHHGQEEKEKGIIIIMITMNILYVNGEELPKDVSRAWELLQKAGEMRDPEAINRIGLAYYSGDYDQSVDYTKALNSFLEAGNLGNAEALKNAGIMYYNGMGVNKDYKKSFEYYNQAAENGSLEALRNIGFMYMVGEGCEKDEKTAKNILKFVEMEESKSNGNSILENDTEAKEQIGKQL
ncbi:hypothetical protein WA158_006878 [Blastocystis sp. Blastoise]